MLSLLPLIIASALAGETSTVTVDAETIQLLEHGRTSSTFALTTYASVGEGRSAYSVTTEQVCEVGDTKLSCEGESATAKWSSGFSYTADSRGYTYEVHDAFLDDDASLTLAVLWPEQPGVSAEYYQTYCGALAADMGNLGFLIADASAEYLACFSGLNQTELTGSWLQTDSWGGRSSGASDGDSLACESELDELRELQDLLRDTKAEWDSADCDNPKSPGWER